VDVHKKKLLGVAERSARRRRPSHLARSVRSRYPTSSGTRRGSSLSTTKRAAADDLFSVRPVILGVSGYLVAVLILVVNDAGSFSEQVSYAFRNPAAIAWETLVAIQVGASAALLPALTAAVRVYPIPSGLALRQLATLGAIALLLFGVLIGGHRIVDPNLCLPVHHQKENVIIFTSFIFLSFLGTLYGMCSVALATVELVGRSHSIPNALSTFLQHSRSLQWYLLIAGLIVGGAALTTGALQAAIASLNTNLNAKVSPNPWLVLIYGGFGSAVIALYYIPVHSALHSAGIALCDRILPMKGDAEEILIWFEKRAKLEAALGLNKNWLDNFKSVLIILTPLAGSAISLLVGKI
jgi:hypothetical protein